MTIRLSEAELYFFTQQFIDIKKEKMKNWKKYFINFKRKGN